MKSLFDLLYPKVSVKLVFPEVNASIGDRLKSRYTGWAGTVWEIIDITENETTQIKLACIVNPGDRCADEKWFSEWPQFILESDTQTLMNG